MSLKQRAVLVLVIIAMVSACSWSQATGAEAIKIMPLGDSVTRGYFGSVDDNGYRKPLYLDLVESGYDIDFVGSERDGNFPDPNHEGYDGQTASWLNAGTGIYDMYERLLLHQPNIVLYHIGRNELRFGIDIDTYAQDANETLEIIYGFDPNITVVLARIILTRDDSLQNTWTSDYNLLIGEHRPVMVGCRLLDNMRRYGKRSGLPG